MVRNVRGIYRGDRIELRDRLNLPLGAEVRLEVEQDRLPLPDVMDLFGVLDDASFTEAVEDAVRARGSSPTRPAVDFDDVSP